MLNLRFIFTAIGGVAIAVFSAILGHKLAESKHNKVAAEEARRDLETARVADREANEKKNAADTSNISDRLNEL